MWSRREASFIGRPPRCAPPRRAGGPGATTHPDPFAADKPRLVITGQNADQFKDQLTAVTYALLKRHPTMRLDVYPTRRPVFFPQHLVDNTLKNATQASTVELLVSGPYPFGQRPAEARPAQQMKDLKVSAVEMAAMREALLQMPAGSKWEVTLPPEQAYGADPRTPFPPNVAVQFEIKLVSVK